MDDAQTAELDAIRSRLAAALGESGGKLRAADALALAGFSSPSYYRSKLVARALLDLGWERGRFRVQNAMLYAYARGTPLERETLITVERGADDQLVVKRK